MNFSLGLGLGGSDAALINVNLEVSNYSYNVVNGVAIRLTSPRPRCCSLWAAHPFFRLPYPRQRRTGWRRHSREPYRTAEQIPRPYARDEERSRASRALRNDILAASE